jgi:hypothetical protein
MLSAYHHTNPDPKPEMDELRRRLYNLPQELFDQIADLTFTIADASPPVITWNYKPPWQLQINHSLRQAYTQHYYSSHDGIWSFRSTHLTSASLLAKHWVYSLSKETRLLIVTAGMRNIPAVPQRILSIIASTELSCWKYLDRETTYPMETPTGSGEAPVVKIKFVDYHLAFRSRWGGISFRRDGDVNE